MTADVSPGFVKKLFGSMGAGGAALLLAAANLASYIAGLARDLFLANVYGATADTDAYFAAFLIPDFLFNFLVLGFVAGALLPVFQSSEKASKEHAAAVFHTFLTLIVLGTTVMSSIAYLLTPALIGLFFGTGDTLKSPEELDTIVSLTRILLLSPILFGISNSLGMILMARKRFFSMAISPILYNIGIILGIVFFGGQFGIEAAVWGAVGGAFLHLLSRVIDFPTTKVGIRPIIQLSSELKRIFWLGVPKTVGLAAFQLVLITFAILSSRLEDGSLAAWNFARNVQSLPVSLFGIAFATAAFPFLSEFAAENDRRGFLHRFQKSAAQILFFALPAAIGLMAVANLTIAVLFEHGAFGDEARKMTWAVLVGVAVAIPFESMTHLLARSFLAFQNTLVAAVGKLLFLFITAVSATFLSKTIGVAAFGFAFSFGAALETIFLATVFHQRYLSLPLKEMWLTASKTLLMSLALLLVVFACLAVTVGLNEFIRLGAALLIGATMYLGLAYVLKIPEISEIFLFRSSRSGEKE